MDECTEADFQEMAEESKQLSLDHLMTKLDVLIDLAKKGLDCRCPDLAIAREFAILASRVLSENYKRMDRVVAGQLCKEVQVLLTRVVVASPAYA